MSIIIYIGRIKKPSIVIIPNKYIVKEGDTLSKIAKKYNINKEDLYSKNIGVVKNGTKKIRPGSIINM